MIYVSGCILDCEQDTDMGKKASAEVRLEYTYCKGS